LVSSVSTTPISAAVLTAPVTRLGLRRVGVTPRVFDHVEAVRGNAPVQPEREHGQGVNPEGDGEDRQPAPLRQVIIGEILQPLQAPGANTLLAVRCHGGRAPQSPWWEE
jgi:hypothetical protein